MAKKGWDSHLCVAQGAMPEGVRQGQGTGQRNQNQAVRWGARPVMVYGRVAVCRYVLGDESSGCLIQSSS